MVKISDKHDVFIFINNDYEIDKKNYKLLIITIIDISPLLVRKLEHVVPKT